MQHFAEGQGKRLRRAVRHAYHAALVATLLFCGAIPTQT
jgi:hypothetical protein